MTTYTEPGIKRTAFNCPYCNAFAKMNNHTLFYYDNGSNKSNYHMMICSHCGESILWKVTEFDNEQMDWTEQIINGVLIDPNIVTAPLPHDDMPENVRKDYNEARSIANYSPKAACALLRLAIQKLCVELGEEGNNINNDIKKLVEKGLPIKVQQALDLVRVVGNNAVHPGTLSDSDIVEISTKLFEIVNFIIEDQITKPKQIDSLYANLPQSTIDAIGRRDS